MLSHFESWTDGIGFRRADKLTVVSPYDEEFAMKKGYQQGSNLVKLENPLADDWLGQPLEKSGDDFNVGFVGSWVERKGVGVLIDVITALSASGSQCTWKIAGVGLEGKRELERIVGHAKIQVYPGLIRGELKDLYKQMNLFLCLSTYESFGMVCSEAMALGCILLSTEVGFAHGLKKDREYLSIEGDTADQIAKKIYRIERNKNTYQEIARAGYERVQKLRWSTAIDELIKHYNKPFK
jgi:glycosyltransferase involved in cell wall biosynthesis